jgi:hypothetical protein
MEQLRRLPEGLLAWDSIFRGSIAGITGQTSTAARTSPRPGSRRPGEPGGGGSTGTIRVWTRIDSSRREALLCDQILPRRRCGDRAGRMVRRTQPVPRSPRRPAVSRGIPPHARARAASSTDDCRPRDLLRRRRTRFPDHAQPTTNAPTHEVPLDLHPSPCRHLAGGVGWWLGITRPGRSPARPGSG